MKAYRRPKTSVTDSRLMHSKLRCLQPRQQADASGQDTELLPPRRVPGLNNKHLQQLARGKRQAVRQGLLLGAPTQVPCLPC